MAGLAAMNDNVDHLAARVFRLRQDRRADRVQIPDVMRDVLRMPLVRALVEIDGDQRIGVQVVARTNCTVKVRRWIAGDEIHGARLEIDRRRHPHAAAERLIERRVLRVGGLFGVDVPMHVTAGQVILRPHAFALFGNRVERPQQVAVLRVVGLHEAANAVLAAVRADQHLAVDDGRRHRFRIAFVGISDLLLP